MNSLTKRLMAGVAAAATLLSGMALAGSAMADGDTAVANNSLTTNQTFTITASSVDDLKGKNLVAVKLADYSTAQTDGTNITGFDVATVSDLASDIYAAANANNVASTKENGDKTGLDSSNPMQWVVTNLLDSNKGNGSDGDNWAGNLRNFLTNLAQKTSITGAQGVTISTENPSWEENTQTASVSAQLPAGVYVILDKSTGNKVVSIPMMNGTTIGGKNFVNGSLGSVQYKASKPTVDKKIVENVGAANEKLVDANTAAIGDTVTYELTTTVPNYTGYTQGYQLTLTDTLSKGLTFGKITSVKIGDTDYVSDNSNFLNRVGAHVWKQVGPDDVDASVTGEYAGGKSFSIKFGQIGNDDNATFNIANDAVKSIFVIGNKITVRYTATLNKDAVIKGKGNPNQVNLTYSRNPNGTETGDSDKHEVRTYTGDLVLHKVDSNGANLAGAKFQVTKKNSDTALKFVKTEVEGNSYFYTLADSSVTTGTVTDLETPSDGKLVIKGLSGEYTVKETAAPTGFSSVSLPSFEAKVAITVPTDKTQDCSKAVTITTGQGDLNGLVTSDETAKANGTYDVQVKNVHNFTEMPKTGATWLCIYAAMAVLCGGGAFLLLRSSKKRA